MENIFVKADVIKKPVENTNSKTPPIIVRQSASADQARAHFNKDDENDYVKKISVPFGGDQMTRVRFAGGKDLRAGANTAKHRFDHCCPFVAELFHTKMAYVQIKEK